MPYVLGAATDYADDIIRELIHGLKFNYLRKAAEPLGALLTTYARTLPQEIFSNAIIVPIPLGKKRYNERGFNQAELIARTLAKSLAIPLSSNFLVRTRETKAQSEIRDREERAQNVQACFVIQEEIDPKTTIILVDDVTTSGSTFHEAAQVLKSAGAKKIFALAVAKA